MPQRSFLIRGLIVLVLVGAGYDSVTRSFAAAWSRTDSVAALSVSSGDARIMASAAQAILERAQTDADRQRAARLAERALARDGTTVPATTALGFFAGTTGNAALGEKWFAYSEKLSRRDFRAQLFFIEKYVSEGDIASALHHYDIALRTSSESAPKVLYPILRSAVADAAVRRELAKTLAARPIWSENFWTDLVDKGPDFAVVAQLMIDAVQRGATVPPVLEETLLNNLAANGQIMEAWRYYVSRHPAAGKQMLRNGNFASVRAGNSPFDWQLTLDNGVVTTLASGTDGRGLEYRVPPTIDATVARQTMTLGVGKYRFDSVMKEAAQKMGAGPYWAITCPDGRAIAALELGGPIEEPKSFAVSFVVPANCGTQSLALVVRASDDVQGASGLISSVSITRVQ